MSPKDAGFYIASQLAGGILGVQVAAILLGMPLGHSAVNYAVTQPGGFGPAVAFAGEFVISSGLFMAILTMSNNPVLSRWTPLVSGLLIAVYIMFEAPLSGMSMNPARTLGSAVCAADYTGIWIYFTAPVLGMLTAAMAFQASHGEDHIFCAKLHHHNTLRCIFRCNYGSLHAKQ